jgi:protein TonB
LPVLDINTSSSTNTSTRDKLLFTAFVALIVHLVIILGVSFSAYSRNNVPPTIEVTLAQHSDNKTPDKADYLAQHNQEASGTLEKKAELTTDKRADFADTAIREVEPNQQKRKAVSEKTDNRQIVSTTSKTDNKTEQKKPTKDKDVRVEQAGEDDEDTVTNSEIASLQAKLAHSNVKLMQNGHA